MAAVLPGSVPSPLASCEPVMGTTPFDESRDRANTESLKLTICQVLSVYSYYTHIAHDIQAAAATFLAGADSPRDRSPRSRAHARHARCACAGRRAPVQADARPCGLTGVKFLKVFLYSWSRPGVLSSNRSVFQKVDTCQPAQPAARGQPGRQPAQPSGRTAGGLQPRSRPPAAAQASAIRCQRHSRRFLSRQPPIRATTAHISLLDWVHLLLNQVTY